MGVIFLSYRRGDSAATCERIYDRLLARFGKDSVFMDVDAIPIGVRFPHYLTTVVQQADVFLAIIGPHWRDIRADDGARRLDDPHDFVRLEVEAALRHHIPLVPVLVDGATMPLAAQLPESLHGLAEHNAIAIRRNPDFDGDVNRLVEAIEPLRVRSQSSPLDQLAALGVYVSFALACAVLIGVALLLLGVRLPIAGASPLLDLIHRYPIATLVVTGLLALATLSSVILLRANAQANKPVPEELEASMRTGWRGPRQGIALATSSTSALTLFALLAITLARPSWCPTALCPPPQIVTRGIHDDNLEIYLTGVQAPAYTIPGDPARYGLGNLPDGVGAVRLDQQSTAPFELVIGIHSLQTGRYGLVIERVALLVQSVPTLPDPLNVWQKGAPLEYHGKRFQATYLSEEAGQRLTAARAPDPNQNVQLQPGESDEIDLLLISRALVDMRFQVQVTYRANDAEDLRTLTLPQVFEVAFSNATDWHLYTLQQNGRFAPSSS
jgi:hypothetical protein